MQTFLYYLTPERPGKQTHAAEENSQAQIEELKEHAHHARVFFDIAVQPQRAVQSVPDNQEHRCAGEQVYPQAAPPEKVFLQFHAQDGSQLCGPQLPGCFAEESAQRFQPAHTVPPSLPIRY